MKLKLNKKILLKIIIAFCITSLLGIATIFGISEYVKSSVADKIITPQQATSLKDVDCIIVLGCYVNETTPCNMLEDRLKVALNLYNNGVAPKILMSGDHGREDYDEVNAMKLYATERSVPSEDVFMDHAGFSTYESMYRSAEIFQAQKVLIVTQEYHLYRAIYIAEQLGLEAYGVSSDLQNYVKQPIYNLREVLARDKDFVQSLFKTKPTYLGEAIPINGNGNITNDKKSV